MRQFVGRSVQSDAFREALAASTLPFALMYIHGPGGVGKTWLLKHFAAVAEQHQARVVALDSRNIDPSSGGFLTALRGAAGATAADEAGSRPAGRDDSAAAIWRALAPHTQRCVILIDTYELLAPLDGWLRESFLPELPQNVLVVLAGRQAPNAAWRADAVWNALMRVEALRNLNPDESLDYLRRRAIPEEHQRAALSFTHGHPLALSLVADTYAQRGSLGGFTVDDAPDIVKALLDTFVQKVPGPAHRAALEACALVRVLTEGLLSRMLNVPDAHELFDWLRGLSFVDSMRTGLYPHDLARAAITADVRWRNPDWYAELHKRARAYYTSRLGQVQGFDQQRALFDLTFLHRDNSIVRPFFDWQESGSVRIEPLPPAEAAAVVDAVRAAEGESAAAAAAYFIRRRPDSALALHEGRRLVGYVVRVPLHEIDDDDRAADPVIDRAWRHVRASAPLRPGELASFERFWGALDTYQQVSPVQSLIAVSSVQFNLTTPRLAVSLLHCAYPDAWTLPLTYADLARMSELDYSAGGTPFGVYWHDWRQTPPAAWLDLLAEREIAANPPAAPPTRKQAQMIALSEAEFADALRDALKQLSRSATLRGNPLLGSRLVTDSAGGAAASESERAAALKKLIVDAAHVLQATPRDAKLHRAFYHTYLQPAVSQEAAAELIDVPFSTYRRHLHTAIERVTATLWRKELGE